MKFSKLIGQSDNKKLTPPLTPLERGVRTIWGLRGGI
jgi:hypothetical protein